MSAAEPKPDKPKCTVQDLLDVITAPSNGFTMMPSNSMDEVYPSLYVGDVSSARNLFRLQRTGITHVLNTAHGTTSFHVNLNADYYEKKGITFLGIPALDDDEYELDQHWEETSEFIDAALKANGKVLVHCQGGCSRSATITLAYLMLKNGMTALEAMTEVRKHREVCPNDGFLQKLCNLDEQLCKSRVSDAKEDTDGSAESDK